MEISTHLATINPQGRQRKGKLWGGRREGVGATWLWQLSYRRWFKYTASPRTFIINPTISLHTWFKCGRGFLEHVYNHALTCGVGWTHRYLRALPLDLACHLWRTVALQSALRKQANSSSYMCAGHSGWFQTILGTKVGRRKNCRRWYQMLPNELTWRAEAWTHEAVDMEQSIIWRACASSRRHTWHMWSEQSSGLLT